MSNDSLKIGVAFTLIVLVAIVVTALHFIDSCTIIIAIIGCSVVGAGIAIVAMLGKMTGSSRVYMDHTQGSINAENAGNTPRPTELSSRGSILTERPLNPNVIGVNIQ